MMTLSSPSHLLHSDLANMIIIPPVLPSLSVWIHQIKIHSKTCCCKLSHRADWSPLYPLPSCHVTKSAGRGEGRDWLLCENQALLCMLITRLDEGSVAFILYSQTQTQPSAGITLQQVHITFYNRAGYRDMQPTDMKLITQTPQRGRYFSIGERERRMELICVSLSVLGRS